MIDTKPLKEHTGVEVVTVGENIIGRDVAVVEIGIRVIGVDVVAEAIEVYRCGR